MLSGQLLVYYFYMRKDDFPVAQLIEVRIVNTLDPCSNVRISAGQPLRFAICDL